MLPPPKLGSSATGTPQKQLGAAQGERQRQAKAYDMDRSHNQSQMDQIRHAQYSKQNTAVNKQKSRMQTNAAQSSKAVTGSADYFKEEFTLQDFIELCESKGKRSRRRSQRANKRYRNEGNRGTGEERDAPDTHAKTNIKDMVGSKDSPVEPAESQEPRQFRKTSPKRQAAGQATLAKRADDYKERERQKAREKQAKTDAEAKAKRQSDRDAYTALRLKRERERDEREKAKEEARKKQAALDKKHSGVGAGIKSALGGDHFSSDPERRRKARTETGKRVGKALRSAPGKFARAALRNRNDDPGDVRGPKVQANKASLVK